MKFLAAGLLVVTVMYGSSASAQASVSAENDIVARFPAVGYRPIPPHFQPRQTTAVDADHTNDEPPPPLPLYQQPAIPENGYLWTPGYWARRKSVSDYFWVPGTWVKPPELGLLWTPPYWSQIGDTFAFHAGYWAKQVGFYGGIDYGYGYNGSGYQGARWVNGALAYNRAVNNLGSTGITAVYGEMAPPEDNGLRISFSGGRAGTAARPTQSEEALAGERRIAATAEQQKQFVLAAMDRSQYSKLNKGRPGVAATTRAGLLDGEGITHSDMIGADARPASAANPDH